LRHYGGGLVPTFKGPRMLAATCQIDKVFVSSCLAARLLSCNVGDEDRVFGSKLSDHLPVVADFRSLESAG